MMKLILRSNTPRHVATINSGRKENNKISLANGQDYRLTTESYKAPLHVFQNIKFLQTRHFT